MQDFSSGNIAVEFTQRIEECEGSKALAAFFFSATGKD
jgi:hypothetical protein